MPRDHQKTQWGGLEADDKPPFTFPPERRLRPVRVGGTSALLKALLAVTVATSAGYFILTNFVLR